MTNAFHRTLAILLSGAVLTSSVLPPAVCHAHVDGDHDHAHGATDGHVEPHSHHGGHQHVEHGSSVADSDDAGHEHGRADHEPSADRNIAVPIAHLHLSIVGFDFSLPMPVGGNSDAPGDDGAGFWGIVTLTDDFTVRSQVDLASIVDVSVADVLTIDVSVDEGDARARWLQGRAERIFLCDSARCERSGVLLI